MRSWKRRGRRGFTLVELMIVVAIIGVLAALAIYGVRRYLASAKTSEAKNSVGAIARGATSAFERESVASQTTAEGTLSQTSSHELCGGVTSPVPVAVPKGKKYQPKTGDGNDFNTGDGRSGWRCVKFALNQPHYYQYDYNVNENESPGNPAACTADCFEALARGDLDGDTVTSAFALSGFINTTNGMLKLATQIYISNEFE